MQGSPEKPLTMRELHHLDELEAQLGSRGLMNPWITTLLIRLGRFFKLVPRYAGRAIVEVGLAFVPVWSYEHEHNRPELDPKAKSAEHSPNFTIRRRKIRRQDAPDSSCCWLIGPVGHVAVVVCHEDDKA